MAAPIIVYDLDGTLADTAGDLMGALNFVLERDGLAPLPVENARSLLGAGGRALIERGFAASGHELSPQKLEVLFGDFLAHYNAHIAVHTRLYPGVLAALDAFAAAGWVQAICTNKIEASAKLLIRRLGVADRFAFICGQDTFGVGKPDPKPLIGTVVAAGGSKGRAIMVGDSATDIKTARAAGLPVIAVDFGYTDVPVTELGPDRVISHFDELEAACADLMPVLALRRRDRPARATKTARPSILRALYVTAVFCLDDDTCPRGDVRGHHRARAVRQLGGFVGRRGRLALHCRLRFDDLERHARRKLDPDRQLVEDRENDLHAFLQPLRLVANNVGGHRDLVVGLGVHEVVAVTVGVEEVEVLVLDKSALDLLGGLEAVRDLHAVGQAAHVDLGRGRALAWMEALSRENDTELPILSLDDVALANRACNNSHDLVLKKLARA